MDKKHVVIVIIVVALLLLFFWPKSECGYNQGYGNFEKARCSCMGFIDRTPEFGELVLDSKPTFSCFGIKTGETKIIYQMYNISPMD